MTPMQPNATDSPADTGTARPAADAAPPTAASPDFEVEDILASVRRRVRLQAQECEQLHTCPIAPRELPAGMRLHGYTLRQVLGAGGFGISYLAEEEATGQRVVLKEHFPEYLCQREAESLDVQVVDEDMAPACEAARASFLREHALLSTLQHPHIPRASACFEAHNTAYYATEYIEGMSLGELRRRYSAAHLPLPQQEVYATLVRLLDALHYLHSRELLHRDIKPENILITRGGLPVLIDFGAAHELHSGEPAYVVEAPGFSPAEQGHARGLLGPWTDIYALGASFHYLLTGETLPHSRRRELVDTATPLTTQPQLRLHYHPRLLASIDRATRPHAEDRYPSVSAWLADLRSASGAETR